MLIHLQKNKIDNLLAGPFIHGLMNRVWNVKQLTLLVYYFDKK